MKDKKLYEVSMLAPFIAKIAEDKGLEYVVDVGSGQGYFSQVLAIRYGLHVLGIESKEHNTKVSQERANSIVEAEKKSREEMPSTTDSDLVRKPVSEPLIK
jgi:tRNA1(Val) A37 N6-methylase TrmN6